MFARDEVEQIISHIAIPADRQIVYALELLAGVRPGEAAALRWRHYEPQVNPLGKLLVAVSYNTRKHRQKSTKTATVKHVPVHPTLAAMLAEWKLGGWAEMMGRAPEPDDLIVPLPPDAAARDARARVMRTEGTTTAASAGDKTISPRLAGGTDGTTTCAPRSSRSRWRMAPIRTWSKRA